MNINLQCLHRLRLRCRKRIRIVWWQTEQLHSRNPSEWEWITNKFRENVFAQTWCGFVDLHTIIHIWIVFSKMSHLLPQNIHSCNLHRMSILSQTVYASAHQSSSAFHSKFKTDLNVKLQHFSSNNKQHERPAIYGRIIHKCVFFG